MLYNGVILDGLHGDRRFLDSARNDGERGVSAARYPLSSYHEKKDGFDEQGKASNRGASTACP